MHYILLAKLEYPSAVSLKVKGLEPFEISSLKIKFDQRHIEYSTKDPLFFEIDLTGIELLNILATPEYGYRVISQSMAMEHSNLGGRSFQIEKIVWTLERQSSPVALKSTTALVNEEPLLSAVTPTSPTVNEASNLTPASPTSPTVDKAPKSLQ